MRGTFDHRGGVYLQRRVFDIKCCCQRRRQRLPHRIWRLRFVGKDDVRSQYGFL